MRAQRLTSTISTHEQRREGGMGAECRRDLIARGRGEVEAEEILVEGGLRELRLRVQERRRAAAPHNALREGLLRVRHRLRPLLRPRRHGRGGGTRLACAAAPSGPTEIIRNTGRSGSHVSEQREQPRREGAELESGDFTGEGGRRWSRGRTPC